MYMTRSADDVVTWIPELDYYIRLVRRIVESKATKVLREISHDDSHSHIFIVYLN